MAINISDSFHAAARVTWPAPGVPALGSQSGFDGTIVKNGVGDVTIFYDQEIDVATLCAHATPTGNKPVMVTCTSPNDQSLRIQTFDNANAPIDDVEMMITVWRHKL